ncbi:MAG: carboxyl transferase domain-containing protein [Sneathiellaceae bacterium]
MAGKPDAPQAAAEMQALVEQLQAERALLDDAARPASVARQAKRAQMTARGRIAALVDAGSFCEIGGLVREAGDDRLDRPADGLVAGSARIDGRWVTVVAQDFTVQGGSSGVLGSEKIGRAAASALREGTPLVMLLDGGGHRIQTGQDSRHFARADPLFHDLARMSGWVPMVAAMLGAGFAGPTNYAGMADFVVMVRGQSCMGLAGPALVKAGTGEEIDIESLGGAAVQTERHGLADLAVADEAAALDAVRAFLGYLPSNAQLPPPRLPAPAEDPARDAGLLGLVPANTRKAYDVRKVVALIADPESVFELKPGYARNAVTAFARLGGRPVGIIANQPMQLGGMLTSPACEKIAHFVALCDAYGLPLVYLIDVPGFSIGSAAERSQLGRRSAKLIFELGHATVPRLSIVLRKGYGLGYFAMCGGRSFDADAAFAWPTAEICAMSIEGAVDVAYRREIERSADPAARRAELIAEMRSRITPLGGAEGFGLDDVIDPRETRARLLAVLDRAPARRANPMPPKVRSIVPI